MLAATQPAPAPRIARRAETDAHAEVDERREQDQAEETPVPGAIEEIARGQQEEILPAVREQPVDDQADREEDEEGEAVEHHARALSVQSARAQDAQPGRAVGHEQEIAAPLDVPGLARRIDREHEPRRRRMRDVDDEHPGVAPGDEREGAVRG